MSLTAWKKWYLSIMSIFFVVYAAILVFDIPVLSAYGNVFGLIGIDLGLCAFLIGIKAHKHGVRLPWFFFALTAISSFIGQAIWAFYDHVLNITVTSPALPDFFKVSYTLFCIAGIVTFLRRDNVNLASFSGDLVISLIAAVGLIYIFLIDPVIEEATGITSTLFFRIFYPVFDFGILFGCMVIFFNTEREGLGRQSPLLMILGFIIMFIGDQINLLNELHHFTDIRYIEPIWSLAFCVLGISCIASAEEKSSKNKIILSSSVEKINIIEIVRTLFPYFITFSLLFFIFVHYELYNFSFCWAMFLVFILSIRQFFVLMNNKKLNSELQKLNIKIMEDAKIDFLTKIANRRHINDVLKDLAQEKTITRLGLLFIDLDNFKKINDTYGHDGGDAVLQGVANAIRQSLRETDVAGRFGGDEFIAILPGADSSAVASVGERIREHVRLDGKLSSWNVTLSIGGASSVSRNINLLMKTADLALYEAKEGGKNRLVIAREPQEVAKTA